MSDTSGDDGAVGDPAYFCALGKFVETFSMAETFLFMYLEHLAELDARVARALLTAARCDTMIDNIRRIWRVKWPGDEVLAELDPVLIQLKNISNVRNSVVHHMVVPTDEGQFVSSN